MFTQRHTAYKVRINDLFLGEYVQREGESDYIQLNDKKVSRVRIIATVVNKYSNENSGTLVIDDGTGVINVRAWENEFHLIDKINIGDLIEIIGRVRKYNEDIYLIPEILKKTTPNWYILRKLELSKIPKIEPKEEVKEIKPEENKVSLNKNENADVKEKIFNFIKSRPDGASIDELINLVNDKRAVIDALMSLIDEDLIFEPKAGIYKLL